MKRYSVLLLTVLVMVGSLSLELLAQTPVSFPRVSPQRETAIRIGFNDVVINYHAPSVRNRQIWNGVVPYGSIWRAGANENTTITFDYDVGIEGKALPAGTYGVHMIPGESRWTIIFNKDHTAWGSFNYRESEDALRVDVTPVSADHREWLGYDFEDVTRTSVVAYMHWEKVKVPFAIEMDGHGIVLSHMRGQLMSLAGFNELGWRQAATYCLNNNTHIKEGLSLIEQSITRNKNQNNLAIKARLQFADGQNDAALATINEAVDMGDNFATLQAKSRLLDGMGNKKGAEKAMKKAVDVGSENELNNYGYQLLGQNNVEEAVRIFKLNVKRHPDSWNVWDSLGEGYDRAGNTSDAIKNYKTALQKAPDAQKSRIQGILSRLQSS